MAKMKRWAIAKLVIDPEDGSLSPKVAIYKANFRAWTKANFDCAFCQIASKDLAAMQDDPEIYILPDGTMDLAVGSIPVSVRNTMKTRLEAAGFVFTAVKTSWTVRQLLTYLAQQIQPNTNVESGDVLDQEV